MNEPDRESDLYCERKEREYRALIEGKTCLDCHNAALPVKEKREDGYGGIGYCPSVGDFVFEEDTPETMECEGFEI